MPATLPAILAGLGLTAAATLSPVAHGPTPAADSFCAVAVEHPDHVVCAASHDALQAAWRVSEADPDTQVTIAILYDNINMDSSAGEFDVHAASDCTASKSGVDFQISDLGSAWRNRISSFQSFGHCETRLWSSTGFAGSAYPSSTGFLVSTTNVGAAFNDKAQSAQFS